jgi:hypothetical protein
MGTSDELYVRYIKAEASALYADSDPLSLPIHHEPSQTSQKATLDVRVTVLTPDTVLHIGHGGYVCHCKFIPVTHITIPISSAVVGVAVTRTLTALNNVGANSASVVGVGADGLTTFVLFVPGGNPGVFRTRILSYISLTLLRDRIRRFGQLDKAVPQLE